MYSNYKYKRLKQLLSIQLLYYRLYITVYLISEFNLIAQSTHSCVGKRCLVPPMTRANIIARAT